MPFPLDIVEILVLALWRLLVFRAWWRHQMETFSALLALCAENSPVPMNSPHKGQWRGALMFSLIYAWINDWVNNREAGDLRRQRGHCDVIVMFFFWQRHESLMDCCTYWGVTWFYILKVFLWHVCIYPLSEMPLSSNLIKCVSFCKPSLIHCWPVVVNILLIIYGMNLKPFFDWHHSMYNAKCWA